MLMFKADKMHMLYRQLKSNIPDIHDPDNLTYSLLLLSMAVIMLSLQTIVF